MKIYVRAEKIPPCTGRNIIDLHTGKPLAGGVNIWFRDPVSDRWVLFDYKETNNPGNRLELRGVDHSQLYTRQLEGGGSPFLESKDTPTDCRYPGVYKIREIDGTEFHRLYGILLELQDERRRYARGEIEEPSPSKDFFNPEDFPSFARLIQGETVDFSPRRWRTFR